MVLLLAIIIIEVVKTRADEKEKEHKDYRKFGK
jgi:hypothetical protein